MKHAFRFWGKLVATTPEVVWQLDADEVKQVSKVLRLKVGDLIEVQSPDGAWSQAFIAELDANHCSAKGKSLERQVPAQRFIRIISGILKPADVDVVLPSLVELGVAEIHLFLTEGAAKHRLSDKHHERWQRILRAASKQCKRAGVPLLLTYESLPALLQSDFYKDDQKLALDPDSALALSEVVREGGETAVSVVIGSEAGLSNAETASLYEHGFSGVHCGPYILRGLTAAILAGTLATYLPMPQKTLS